MDKFDRILRKIDKYNNKHKFNKLTPYSKIDIKGMMFIDCDYVSWEFIKILGSEITLVQPNIETDFKTDISKFGVTVSFS